MSKIIVELQGAVNKNTPSMGTFLQEYVPVLSESDSVVSLDAICNELANLLRSHSAEIVNRATFITSELAKQCPEHVTLRMGQKEFQQNLYYTLRGKTSFFGNRFTMHPLLWMDIERRVLALYEYWYAKHMMEEHKYKNILEKYRTIKGLGIQFPGQQQMVLLKNKPPKTKQEVCQEQVAPISQDSREYQGRDSQFKELDSLIKKYETMVSNKQTELLLKTETVRLMKNKCKQLHQTFSDPDLTERDKARVKDMYSRLRKILKELDLYNEHIKLKKEQEYVQSKINNLGGSRTIIKSQGLIEGPEGGAAEETIMQLHNSPSKKESAMHREENLLDFDEQLNKELDTLNFRGTDNHHQEGQFDEFVTSMPAQQEHLQDIQPGKLKVEQNEIDLLI